MNHGERRVYGQDQAIVGWRLAGSTGTKPEWNHSRWNDLVSGLKERPGYREETRSMDLNYTMKLSSLVL